MDDIAVLANCVDSQGCFLDPIQIKKSSAAKMRLADKTGNIALRKEAAAEQSFADRLGGRTALLSDELKLQIQKQKEQAALTASPQEESSTEKSDGDVVEPEVSSSPTSPTPLNTTKPNTPPPQQKRRPKQQQVPTQPIQIPQQIIQVPTTAQPTVIYLPSTFTTPLSLPPEALILKLDAATKQSIADKTGNLALKKTAALEQSLADKMAFVSSSGTTGVTTAALHTGRKGFVMDSIFQPQVTVQPNITRNKQDKKSAQSSPSQSPPQSQSRGSSPTTSNTQQQVSPPQQLKWNAPHQRLQPSLQQSMEKRKQRLATRQPISTSPIQAAPRLPSTCIANTVLSSSSSAPKYTPPAKRELMLKQQAEFLHPLAPATAAM